MDRLVFDAHFGEDIKQVEISSPFGTGGAFNIYMEKFYIGVIIHYYQVGWTVMFNRPEFGSDDMYEVLQLVKDHFQLK